jgi:dihydrofolate reductase
MLSHIVAASENNVIGVRNGLPWKLSNDFKYFKNKTWAMPVIMGRRTFESMGKALPGRINIVLTKKTDWHAENIFLVNNLEEAFRQAGDTGAKEFFVIGGGKIFAQTMDLISRIYLTRVHTTVEGDTFYPEISFDKWKLVSQESFSADAKNNFPHTFEVWEKLDKN